MNQRIQELLYEAGGEYGGEHPTTGQTVIYTDEVDYAKFAELIVRECAYVSAGYFGFKDHTPGTAIAKEMKQHFGVAQ